MEVIQYEHTFFEASTIRKAALEMLQNLPPDVMALASAGSSGCSIASAMLALADRPLYHLHWRGAPNTSPHGANFTGYNFIKQYEGTEDKLVVAVVDDFLRSGATLRGLFRGLRAVPTLDAKYVLVGHLEYGNSRDVSAYGFGMVEVMIL